MVDGIGFKESIQIEKEKWSHMNKAQKWDYFKTYYLMKVLVVLVLIFAVISYIRAAHQNKREVLLGGYFLNVNADEELYTYVNEDYFAYLGGDSKKQQMDVSAEHYMELTESGYDNTAYATDMSIVAMFSTGSLDVMFLDDTTMERYSMQSIYADLRDVLTKEQYDALEEYIVDVKDENGSSYPGAICLEGTALAEKYHMYSTIENTRPYLVILVNGQNIDRASDFVDYLFFQNQ